MKPFSPLTALAVVALVAVMCARSFADPLSGEVLKFEQLPLNNGLAPSTGGAPFPGHDELSTASLNTSGTYSGIFAADDFSDNFNTPVVHISWWGSYLNGSNTANGNVQQFLISFESDVPGNSSAGTFSQPGTPLLTETVTPGPLTPGTFTEKLINSSVPEPLYQYNAELALPFQERASTVYWLKIVALANPNQPNLQWGWHNRDWGIPDPLASPVPIPGEHIEGTVANLPIWHFQDDAVNGQIVAAVNAAGTPSILSEVTAGPLNYALTPSGSVPIDGPPGIENFSEDLAFALYTVPEPSTIALLGLGGIGFGVTLWRRRQVRGS
jgi:PEP-CTERM motif